ncbi:hypothetical protein PFICI_05478 [Pestalotiopsis fici W106-1]|uniref:Uncharacterized protein n=1 Tax=Pestalotiopsis fici (strain W106-1 / CGMCC3.15140) TaxID=1229662 RepID=W3XDV0_PESFW|nr:uncharacterized protein PFICI_05478 [Pestalotiopsis fici W106-1]ETS83602.1 hypothetical protein PFICI_05478 [Pestalotiopsis fici W106-1]
MADDVPEIVSGGRVVEACAAKDSVSVVEVIEDERSAAELLMKTWDRRCQIRRWRYVTRYQCWH